MSSPLMPPPDAEQKQALKQTHASFWVTASAGSGKTMLLTQRFLALLLDGALPERILCLTYTRAAASEMATRIMEALKSCSEEREVARLYRAFFDREPNEDEQKRALTLHTRSLDCKGGLRVMTFHAFCQSVLGKFPLESGVPPHFRLVEQGRKQQLGRDALFATTTSPQQLATINDFMALEACATCISDIAARARSPKELARSRARVEQLFLETKPSTTAPLAREVLAREVLTRLESILEQHRQKLKSSDLKKLQKLSAWLKSGEEADYRNLFLTQKGLLSKLPLLTKDTLAMLPDGSMEQALKREAERVATAVREKEQQRLRAINLALYALAEESAKALEAKRKRHAVLDFDDLIDKTQELLTSSQTPWVHYKLDGSFDHVLIDEAQDTNHAQWSIVEQLTEEIFSNPARLPKAERSRPRSLFVVGDEKQSIYSFQGADLRRFVAAREQFRERARNANMPFVELTLTGSYRSLAPVLEAIDQTFATPKMLASLQALDPALDPASSTLDEARAPRPLLHRAHRKEQGGSASLHLLAQNKITQEKLTQEKPTQAKSEKITWAETIATFVAEQVLGENAPPLSNGRSPRAGDVLLLLPQRTQLMQPLLAAFATRKLPCEDIDKFHLTATLQAEDILAWLRFLVLPDDELNLASLLKTPFLDFSEGALQALCLARLERKQNLWHTLSESASSGSASSGSASSGSASSGSASSGSASSGSNEHGEVVRWLKDARAHASHLSPFAALRFLLERPCPRASSGTAALLSVHRNLDPAENLCEEALTFAQSTTSATLSQFVEHLEGLRIDIKRESITQPTDKMRLMTIHGAKGLESPIVVLPLFYLKKVRGETMMVWRDEARDNPTSLYLPAESLDILKGDANPTSLGSRLQQQKEQQAEDLEKEQQRLLYVAMTRARDRLVMLAPEEDAASAHYAQDWSQHLKKTAQKYKWQHPQAPPRSAIKTATAEKTETAETAETAWATPSVVAATRAPSFLFVSPAAETPLQPPRIASRRETHADKPYEQGKRKQRKLDQRQRGKILHRILQKLAEKCAEEPQAAREQQARTMLLQALQPFALEEEERLRLAEDWTAKLLRLLEQPPFFGTEGAPLKNTLHFEVELAGNLPQGSTIASFVGRIDLLLESATTRLFGDLKTDALVPQQLPQRLPQRLPQHYASQFGVYRALLEALQPKKRVEGYVLWFETGEIQKLSEDDMPPPESSTP